MAVKLKIVEAPGVTSTVPVGELFGDVQLPTPAIVTLVARATLHASVNDPPERGTARKCANLGLLDVSVPGIRDESDWQPVNVCAGIRLPG